LTFRTLLLWRIALVLAATLAIGAVLIYGHARSKVETEMAAALAVGERVAANAITDSKAMAEPRKGLALLIANFNGDRHLRASLLGPDGVPVVESRLQPPEEHIPRWLDRLLGGARRSSVLPLPAGMEGLGSLVLETDSRNEVAEAANDARLYLLLLTGCCLATAFLLDLTLRHALQPLQTMTAAFERIGGGHYEARVPVRGPSEMTRLATGFNAMSGRLEGAEAHNERLNAQLEAVQEEERAELARNLHDEVSPLLFSVDVDASTIRRLAADGRLPEIEARAAAILSAVGDIKANVKTVLSQLRPTQETDLDLKDRIENLISFWRDRRPGVSISLDMAEAGYSAGLDAVVQNIVRESLSNALKHSEPTRVAIRIGAEPTGGALVVRIEDDGGGLGMGGANGAGSGFGIIGMRERAELLGGSLEVKNRVQPKGVVVTARLPIAGAATRMEAVEARP
jgi:two-component system, NarL family, sensor histidine kinase UhpB